MSGSLKGLPFADHSRVLEQMFPGWTVAELFEPCSPGDPGCPASQAVEVPAPRSVVPVTGDGLHLVADYSDLQAAFAEVIDGARETLATTGSRSRDPDYLTRIEKAVAGHPGLTHYRVMYGPPRTSMLKDHLIRLMELPDRQDQVRIGVFDDLYRDPERFLCVSEKAAVVVLPSLTSTSNFDSGLVVTDPDVAARYLEHVRQAYLGSQHLTTRAALEALEVLR
ncbi:MAG: XRE family transcriptional regulator [Actinomycetales bacterium]|nr:XRE family transcriptional regulator [Actinomycetales bacterium]